MDDVMDDVVGVVRRCKRLSKSFEKDGIDQVSKRIVKSYSEIHDAWSQSIQGYQASVYTLGFRRPRVGEVFDADAGLNPVIWNNTRGDWHEYNYDEVFNEIMARSGITDLVAYEEIFERVTEGFKECQQELVMTMAVLLEKRDDATIRGLQQRTLTLDNSISHEDFIREIMPRGTFLLSDPIARQQGFRRPPHIQMISYFHHLRSSGLRAGELADLARNVQIYLEKSLKMKGTSVAKTDGKIFIGHGGSHQWLLLDKFIKETLGLETVEFNSDSTAGLAPKERLMTILDEAVFASLVMTAEDAQPDGTMRARENVIHEVGLFQGRYSWERAIILQEEECSMFSNMLGITAIRFPKNNIMAKSEDIRRVLQREKILK